MPPVVVRSPDVCAARAGDGAAAGHAKRRQGLQRLRAEHAAGIPGRGVGLRAQGAPLGGWSPLYNGRTDWNPQVLSLRALCLEPFSSLIGRRACHRDAGGGMSLLLRVDSVPLLESNVLFLT